MKKPLYFLLFGLLILLANCSRTNQEPNLILKEEVFAPDATVEKTYTHTFNSMIGSKSLPLSITWTTYLDTAKNCNRIIGYKFQRVGGPNDVRIDNVTARHDENDTGRGFTYMETISSDEPRFTELSIYANILTYEGIGKVSGSGPRAFVHSDGKVLLAE